MAINPFRNYSLTVKRKAGASFVSGRWTGGSESDIAIKCSVQPLSEKELVSLPEGRRTRENYRIFTDTELFTVDAQNPDEVIYLGERYEVYTVGKWQNQIINHYTYIITKKQV